MMMRFLFALIGLLFDIVIVGLSGFAIYSSVNPDFFASMSGQASEYLSDQQMRIQIGAVAGILFILSFRGLFLLLFGRPEKVYSIRRAESGSLSVSRTTLEKIVTQIASKQTPQAVVGNLSIKQAGSALNLNMSLKLDLSGCNIGEYTEGFEKDVRAYFKNSLGIELGRVDIKAETAPAQG
ncbi:MAG TPA: hypothetical protein PLQ76_09910, partial [bacterium]|nr:hypothetical protein [bacterium]